ncbi:MAG: ABC transporter permease [Planctomycetes bacterium]|nr:ABC transporter permease [Planctomycetota bacterium]
MSTPWLAVVPASLGAALAAWLAIVLWTRLLARGGVVLGIAHTLVREAFRRRVALSIYIAAITYVAALVPLLGSSDRLIHRVQNLLSYGLAGTIFFGLLLAILLGTGSLASEFEERQIDTTLTKPLPRAKLLVGKWVGVMSLIVILLAVLGAQIAVLATLSVRIADDPSEVEQVRSRVLVAVRAVEPDLDQDPQVREQFEKGLPIFTRRNGTRAQALGPAAFRSYAWDRFLDQWRRVPPGESRKYRFVGLRRGEATLRIRPRMTPTPSGNRIEARIGIESEDPQLFEMEIGRLLLLPLPASATEDGVVDIVIEFPAEESEGPIDFTEPESLEVAQLASGFGWNLTLGLLIDAIKLSFVAALAIFGASFLSFPVATLMTTLLTLIALSSNYLISASLEPGGTLYDEKWGVPTTERPSDTAGGAVEAVFDRLEWAGLRVAMVLRKYGEIAPTSSIVEGREVGTATLAQAALWIGGLWTGSVAAVAWLVFRRREIARVQV